jgi:hypothetical protein
VTPHSRQGVEVGRGRPHEAALIQAPQEAGSAATATSEGLLSVAAAVEPHQVVAALTAAMTTAVTVLSIPPAPAPVGGDPRRGHPAARMGPVGEPARTSPRATDGGACGEGSRWRGAGAPG